MHPVPVLEFLSRLPFLYHLYSSSSLPVALHMICMLLCDVESVNRDCDESGLISCTDTLVLSPEMVERTWNQLSSIFIYLGAYRFRFIRCNCSIGPFVKIYPFVPLISVARSSLIQIQQSASLCINLRFCPVC